MDISTLWHLAVVAVIVYSLMRTIDALFGGMAKDANDRRKEIKEHLERLEDEKKRYSCR